MNGWLTLGCPAPSRQKMQWMRAERPRQMHQRHRQPRACFAQCIGVGRADGLPTPAARTATQSLMVRANCAVAAACAAAADAAAG